MYHWRTSNSSHHSISNRVTVGSELGVDIGKEPAEWLALESGSQGPSLRDVPNVYSRVLLKDMNKRFKMSAFTSYRNKNPITQLNLQVKELGRLLAFVKKIYIYISCFKMLIYDSSIYICENNKSWMSVLQLTVAYCIAYILWDPVQQHYSKRGGTSPNTVMDDTSIPQYATSPTWSCLYESDKDNKTIYTRAHTYCVWG